MTAPDATLTGRLREALGEHHLDTDGDFYFCGCGHEYGRVERFLARPDSVEQAMDAHLADVAAQTVAAWLREQRDDIEEVIASNAVWSVDPVTSQTDAVLGVLLDEIGGAE